MILVFQSSRLLPSSVPVGKFIGYWIVGRWIVGVLGVLGCLEIAEGSFGGLGVAGGSWQ